MGWTERKIPLSPLVLIPPEKKMERHCQESVRQAHCHYPKGSSYRGLPPVGPADGSYEHYLHPEMENEIPKK